MPPKDQTAEPMLDAESGALASLKESGPRLGTPAAPAPEMKTIEEWQALRKPDAWAHEAAKHLRSWPLEKRVSADDYDAAIQAALKIEVG